MARWMGKFGGNPLLHRIIESCESTFILWVCILFLLVACFFFCIITYFGHPMAKIQMPHWALARPGAFSMSPLSSPFTSSVVIFFQRQYGSLRLYKKIMVKLGGANIPAAWHRPHWGWGYPACLQEHLHCHDVSLTSTAGRWSTPMLSLGPHAIWVFPNSKSSCHMGIPQLQIFIPFNLHR